MSLIADHPLPFDAWEAVQLRQEITATSIQRFNEAENIILLQPFPGAHIDVPQAMENREASFRLSGKRKAGMLVVGSGEITTTPAMRELCATAEYNEGVFAIALVSALTTMKILGNFYLRINRPVVPTRFFSSPDAARNWLLREAAAYELLKTKV
ncbi:MAG: hypothetical protein ACRC3B_02565 [Bacteroidia bacterium]